MRLFSNPFFSSSKSVSIWALILILLLIFSIIMIQLDFDQQMLLDVSAIGQRHNVRRAVEEVLPSHLFDVFYILEHSLLLRCGVR